MTLDVSRAFMVGLDKQPVDTCLSQAWSRLSFPRVHECPSYNWCQYRSNTASIFLYFKCLALVNNIILRVYYTIPFGFSFFGHFLALFFNFYNYFLWLRITDEGSIPEMRIWSILLIKSALKWCIHLSRSLYLYIILQN